MQETNFQNPQAGPIQQLEVIESQTFLRSLSSIIKYILLSFIVVHLFGIFGVFISLAYPLLWFFIPGKVWCFYCLHQVLRRGNERYCKVCERQVVSVYSPPFKSMIVNTITMLILSFFFFLLVLGEVLFITRYSKLIFAPPNDTEFVTPAANTFQLGKEFYYDIEIKNLSQPINLVRSDLRFPNDLLEVREIDISQSFSTIFARKEFSNSEGLISILGGLPNPGFLGEKGHFVRIKFMPKKTGAGSIKFLETSKIFANDGHGTNILYKFNETSIIITP